MWTVPQNENEFRTTSRNLLRKTYTSSQPLSKIKSELSELAEQCYNTQETITRTGHLEYSKAHIFMKTKWKKPKAGVETFLTKTGGTPRAPHVPADGFIVLAADFKKSGSGTKVDVLYNNHYASDVKNGIETIMAGKEGRCPAH